MMGEFSSPSLLGSQAKKTMMTSNTFQPERRKRHGLVPSATTWVRVRVRVSRVRVRVGVRVRVRDGVGVRVLDGVRVRGKVRVRVGGRAEEALRLGALGDYTG